MRCFHSFYFYFYCIRRNSTQLNICTSWLSVTPQLPLCFSFLHFPIHQTSGDSAVVSEHVLLSLLWEFFFSDYVVTNVLSVLFVFIVYSALR